MVGLYAEFPDDYTSDLICRKARQLCRHSAFSRSDQPDIEQELWLHILKRRGRYDPRYGSVEAFTNLVLTNKMRSMLRHALAHRRCNGREAFSVNDRLQSGDGEPTSRHETLRSHVFSTPDAGDLSHDLYAMMERLPGVECAVAAGLLAGLSQRRIAKHLRVSRRRVAQAVASIRQFARDMKLDDYLAGG